MQMDKILLAFQVVANNMFKVSSSIISKKVRKDRKWAYIKD